MNIKKLRELKKNKKGFTLIEIIVVVIILAVLLAVAVPSVLSYMDEADNAKLQAQARGGMYTAQAEATKLWIAAADDAKPSSYTATADQIAKIGGTPEIKGITATIDPSNGNITQIIVTFEDKKVTIDPNEKMTIDDYTPPAENNDGQ